MRLEKEKLITPLYQPEERGIARLIPYVMGRDDFREGDKTTINGLLELNLSKRWRFRAEGANFDFEEQWVPMVGLTYCGFYPERTFVPHLGAAVQVGDKPKNKGYIAINAGFIYKPWHLFGELKAVYEKEIDFEKTEFYGVFGIVINL